MPETPDFDQIANQIVDRYQAVGEVRGLVDDALRGAIIDAVRLAWNARGAEDLATLEWREGFKKAPTIEALKAEIRKLDR